MAKLKLSDRPFELRVRPIATPQEPLGAERVPQQRHCCPGDGFASTAGPVPKGPRKLHPHPTGGCDGEEIAKTRIADAELRVRPAEMIYDDIDPGLQQGPD